MDRHTKIQDGASQGSAATDLRWGENFNIFLFRNSLLYIAVKKLRKSVNICLSYHKIKVSRFFMAHSVHTLTIYYIHFCHHCQPPLNLTALDGRTHSYQHPGHSTYPSDCNFLTRMLYKNSY